MGCGDTVTPELVAPDERTLPELDAVPHRRSGLREAVLDGGLVVLHPETGRFQVLSTSAALVYTSVDGVTPISALVEGIARDTGSDPAHIEDDVRRALASMAHEMLVSYAPDVADAPPGRPAAERWAAVRRDRFEQAAWPHRLGPHLAGATPIEVRLASDEVAERVRPLLALLPTPQASTLESSVVAAPAGPRGGRVYLDGVALERRTHDAELTAEVVLAAVNQAAASGPAHALRLHAAAVERDGAAVVVCGTSGSGKSSLTTALLAAGWHYLTDEVAVIDPSTRAITPYPKWVDLSTEALQRVGHRPATPPAPTTFEHHLPPATLGAVSLGARVAAVVVLDRQPPSDAAPIARTLDPTEALLTLLGHVFESTWESPSSLQGLADLCSTAPTTVLRRAPFATMVAEVARLVDAAR